MLTLSSGEFCFSIRELQGNTFQRRFICGAISVDICAPWERRRNLWTTRAYRMAVRRRGTKLASFREAVDVPSRPLAIVSSERPLPRITNAKCFLRYPDIPTKLKRSNIARSQYATELVCMYVFMRKENKSDFPWNRRFFFYISLNVGWKYRYVGFFVNE